MKKLLLVAVLLGAGFMFQSASAQPVHHGHHHHRHHHHHHMHH